MELIIKAGLKLECKSSETTSNYFASILLSSFKSTVAVSANTPILPCPMAIV
jgi:hypothetical protein